VLSRNSAVGPALDSCVRLSEGVSREGGCTRCRRCSSCCRQSLAEIVGDARCGSRSAIPPASQCSGSAARIGTGDGGPTDSVEKVAGTQGSTAPVGSIGLTRRPWWWRSRGSRCFDLRLFCLHCGCRLHGNHGVSLFTKTSDRHAIGRRGCRNGRASRQQSKRGNYRTDCSHFFLPGPFGAFSAAQFQTAIKTTRCPYQQYHAAAMRPRSASSIRKQV
jgi:hypothetical protein